LALKLRDENGLHGIHGQILNLPATCHPKQFPHEKYELNSYEQNYDSPTINGKHMYWFWGKSKAEHYLRLKLILPETSKINIILMVDLIRSPVR